MKIYFKISIVLFFCYCNQLTSQTVENDSVVVIVNGQRAVVNKPSTGARTTINFEDSNYIFQVAVSKIAKKNGNKIAQNSNNIIAPNTEFQRKKILWFNEFYGGVVTLSGKRIVAEQTSIFALSRLADFGSQYFTFFPVQTVNPGFRIGLKVKDKFRSYENMGVKLRTGFGIQYSRFSSEFTINGVIKKTDTVGGFATDSIVDRISGAGISRFANFQMLFPVSMNKAFEFKGEPMNLSIGVNFGLSLANANNKIINATNKNNEFAAVPTIFGNIRTPFFLFQPIVQLNYKKVNLILTYDIGQTKLGSSQDNKSTYGRIFSACLGYKLY